MDNKSAFNVSQYDDNVRKVIPFYDEIYNQIFDIIHTHYAKGEKYKMPFSILDTGCGSGTFAVRACEELNISEMVLCDPSEKMLSDAQNKLKDKNCIFRCIGSENLDYTEKFDVIVAIQSHHYFSREMRERAVMNCFKALKSGGIFIYTENTAPFSETGKNIVLKRVEEFSVNAGRSREDAMAHSARYNVEYFPLNVSEHLDLLRKTGFETSEIFWHSYMQSGFYAIKTNYYTVDNAKVYYEYDEDEQGYFLEYIEGKTDNFVIPDKINDIDVKGFSNLEDFNDRISGKIIVSENNKYFKVIDDVLFSKDGTNLYIYMQKKKNENYIIPSGVKIIAPDAFSRIELKNIVISEGVTHIYQYAFAVSKNVEKIYLPSTLEMISLKVFLFFGTDNLQVYYGGTPEQWEKLNSEYGRFIVYDKIYYNSPVPDIDENGNIIFKERY
ncbi:MAG: methyltransferase domain-containing protein [Alistipes senegalensis]|nr:methyltransferase domain-containing protein [Alistipes senegalensis]